MKWLLLQYIKWIKNNIKIWMCTHTQDNREFSIHFWNLNVLALTPFSACLQASKWFISYMYMSYKKMLSHRARMSPLLKHNKGMLWWHIHTKTPVVYNVTDSHTQQWWHQYSNATHLAGHLLPKLGWDDWSLSLSCYCNLFSCKVLLIMSSSSSCVTTLLHGRTVR